MSRFIVSLVEMDGTHNPCVRSATFNPPNVIFAIRKGIIPFRDVMMSMYEEREVAPIAIEDIRRVANNRIQGLDGSPHVNVEERLGTSPRIILSIMGDSGPAWKEFIESSLTRGAPAFDPDYIAALVSCGHIALHYPEVMFDDGFMEEKAEDLKREASKKGARTAEVHAFLYSVDGTERKVL